MSDESKEKAKKALSDLDKIVEEGNLSSTLSSFKKNSLEAIEKALDANSMDEISSLIRLGYHSVEAICKKGCKIINDKQDQSQIFKDSVESDFSLYLDAFESLIVSSIDAVFVEADAATLKQILGVK